MLRGLVIAVCGVLGLGSLAVCQVTQAVKTKRVLYEAWGLQFEVPQVSRKVSLKPTDEFELWDLFLYGDFAYFIKIVKTPADSLTSTAIEQDIQATANFFAKRGQTKRWEMEPRGRLFKGLNYYARVEEDIPEAAAELSKILRGRTACISCVWTPLTDESSPMLLLGLVGPKGRDQDVENLARLFVYQTVQSSPDSETKPVPKTQPAARPAQPPPPKTQTTPKPRPTLKKGDIEIIGRVETISADKKSLIIFAEQIRLPETGVIKLDPRRKKTVLLEKLPAAVVVGANILVIGKNKGVGTPIKADWIEPAP